MMKKFVSFLLMLALCLSCALADTIPAGIPVGIGEEADIAHMMEVIGPDLAARAQAAGLTLTVSYSYYANPEALTSLVPVVSIEICSAPGTTWPDKKVDTELMYALQCAVLDSNILGVRPEEIEELKQHYYHNKDKYFYQVDRSFAMAYVIELYITETPGYEAFYRIQRINEYSRRHELLVQESGYSWGELHRRYTPPLNEYNSALIEKHGLTPDSSFWQ